MSSRTFIGGNWKCNGTSEDAKILTNELLTALNDSTKDFDGTVVICPPTLHIPIVQSLMTSNNTPKNLNIAAQNCSATGFGAYTGEVCCEMIKGVGVEWVLVGHSERRKHYGETDDVVTAKLSQVMASQLKSILCVGETLEERKANKVEDVLSRQLCAANKAKEINWDNIVVAYEPVWAIGTGEVATREQAQEAHAFIRKWICENVSDGASNKLRIIYGGSVNGSNASDLFKGQDIDGFLVGGASLKVGEFVKIIKASVPSSSLDAH